MCILIKPIIIITIDSSTGVCIELEAPLMAGTLVSLSIHVEVHPYH